jgi:hypothetical protein
VNTGSGPGASAVDPPTVELLRVDPRLLDVVTSLFWATFPNRRLGRGEDDADGRVPLLVDAELTAHEGPRWQRALDALLRQPFAADRGAYQREVRDGRGRRLELALPVAPDAYRGGAWLVGPFATVDEAHAWAAEAVHDPWVHDVVDHAGSVHADVFLGESAGLDVG